MRTPQELAEEVVFWTEDFPSPSAVAVLREALDKADSRWISGFREADGVSHLCGVRGPIANIFIIFTYNYIIHALYTVPYILRTSILSVIILGI